MKDSIETYSMLRGSAKINIDLFYTLCLQQRSWIVCLVERISEGIQSIQLSLSLLLQKLEPFESVVSAYLDLERSQINPYKNTLSVTHVYT